MRELLSTNNMSCTPSTVVRGLPASGQLTLHLIQLFVIIYQADNFLIFLFSTICYVSYDLVNKKVCTLHLFLGILAEQEDVSDA